MLADRFLKQAEAQRALPAGPAPAAIAPAASAELQPGHSVLIGFGRVGSAIARKLAERGESLIVIEDSEDRAAAANAAGIRVIHGNGATAQALAEAHVVRASTLYVAVPNVFEAGQAVEQGRRLNSRLYIVARAHSDEEAAHLKSVGADQVVMGETEIGLGMVDRAAHRPNERS